jgi:hypothetical protein
LGGIDFGSILSFSIFAFSASLLPFIASGKKKRERRRRRRKRMLLNPACWDQQHRGNLHARVISHVLLMHVSSQDRLVQNVDPAVFLFAVG